MIGRGQNLTGPQVQQSAASQAGLFVSHGAQFLVSEIVPPACSPSSPSPISSSRPAMVSCSLRPLTACRILKSKARPMTAAAASSCREVSPGASKRRWSRSRTPPDIFQPPRSVFNVAQVFQGDEGQSLALDKQALFQARRQGSLLATQQAAG